MRLDQVHSLNCVHLRAISEPHVTPRAVKSYSFGCGSCAGVQQALRTAPVVGGARPSAGIAFKPRLTPLTVSTHPPKPTPHQKREAIKRRQHGETLADIARSYNVSPATISRLAG